MLTAGIKAVECRQISHQYSSLKQLISTGVNMYTFAGEARWSIPMIDAVHLIQMLTAGINAVECRQISHQ